MPEETDDQTTHWEARREDGECEVVVRAFAFPCAVKGEPA